jgi:hypothetical protein
MYKQNIKFSILNFNLTILESKFLPQVSVTIYICMYVCMYVCIQQHVMMKTVSTDYLSSSGLAVTGEWHVGKAIKPE